MQVTLSLLLLAMSVVTGKNHLSIRQRVGDDFETPWYYHGLDGPTFKNSTYGDVQTRQYPSYLWASTDVDGTQFDVAQNIGFERLFDYISGQNADNITIDMTTPVLTYVQPGQGPNCETTFTISFFIPFMYQTDAGPPSPTAPEVYISTIGPLQVAVDEFSGYALQPEILARTAALSDKVQEEEQLSIDTSEGMDGTWWEAGYDPPFRVTNRHNEVWVPVVIN